MPKYDVVISVESASGHQVWRVEAPSREAALAAVRSGQFDGEIEFEEVEVTSLATDDVRLGDVREVSDGT